MSGRRLETDDDLRRGLEELRTIAVVGLSPRAHRPSHGVARSLQTVGYRILPVNPYGGEEILGEAVWPSLLDLVASLEWIRDNISAETWHEWIGQGTKVINELRLDFSREEDQAVYDQHMYEFLGIDDEE